MYLIIIFIAYCDLLLLVCELVCLSVKFHFSPAMFPEKALGILLLQADLYLKLCGVQVTYFTKRNYNLAVPLPTSIGSPMSWKTEIINITFP